MSTCARTTPADVDIYRARCIVKAVVMRTGKPYTRFAQVYDLMGADRHSAKMVEYSFKIFRRFNIKATCGLDLCCGTGTAISLFLDQRLQMSGMDQSAAMLALAARKLKGKGVKLYQKSLPRFKILRDSDSRKTRKFDLITCFYDSLNYLKNARELKTAFRSVYNHLHKGGWFIFDMNTPAALKIIWGGQVYADAKDNLAWVWKNTYHEKTRSATCHATFFVKQDKSWERFDEEHVERAYDNAILIRLLREAGFQIKGFYRCFGFVQPKRGTYRICGVAKRQ
jgi:SAM-dependent methyltransferase